jgi:hypothetical protein
VLRRWGPGRSLLFLWGPLLWLFFSCDEGHQAGLGLYQLRQLKSTTWTGGKWEDALTWSPPGFWRPKALLLSHSAKNPASLSGPQGGKRQKTNHRKEVVGRWQQLSAPSPRNLSKIVALFLTTDANCAFC